MYQCLAHNLYLVEKISNIKFIVEVAMVQQQHYKFHHKPQAKQCLSSKKLVADLVIIVPNPQLTDSKLVKVLQMLVMLQLQQISLL